MNHIFKKENKNKIFKIGGLLIFSLLVFLFLHSCKKKQTVEEEAQIEVTEQLAIQKMQEFVINISNYSRSYKTNFILIPQNGVELAFNNANPQNGLNTGYMAAIDGFGVEELFYNGSYTPDQNRLSMLRTLRQSKKVMVSEYVTDTNNINDALTRNHSEGFLCFVRNSTNYYYSQIPSTIHSPNTTDITNLSLAQNYLYLINYENFSSKSALISAIAATNFDVVLIDLFFKQEGAFTSSEINQLKTKANGARRLVICYINIGAIETYRYYWNTSWTLGNPRWIKKPYQGYNDEFWVEFWNSEWQNIIYGNNNSYMKKIIDAGFDGAYLDNVEAYYFLYH